VSLIYLKKSLSHIPPHNTCYLGPLMHMLMCPAWCLHGSQALISLIPSLLHISISFAISPLLYLLSSHLCRPPGGSHTATLLALLDRLGRTNRGSSKRASSFLAVSIPFSVRRLPPPWPREEHTETLREGGAHGRREESPPPLLRPRRALVSSHLLRARFVLPPSPSLPPRRTTLRGINPSTD
jgi:hypothetical protein